MTQYKLKVKKIIRQLNTETHTNVAIVLWVDVIGTDSRGLQVAEELEVPLSPPASDQFTPYQDLTEQQVAQWATDSLKNTPQSKFDDQADAELTRMQYVEQIIDARLQEMELASGLPWENE
jgi:hypothetical protein